MSKLFVIEISEKQRAKMIKALRALPEELDQGADQWDTDNNAVLADMLQSAECDGCVNCFTL